MRRCFLVVASALVLVACDDVRPTEGASASAKLPASVSGPSQPWLDFFAAVRAKDYATAHAQMVARYRSKVSVGALRAAIEKNPLVVEQNDATTFSYGGGRGDGGSLHAEGAILTSLGAVRFETFYVHEDGANRLVSILVAGVPLVGVGVGVAEEPALAPSASSSAQAPPP